ncbi:MAG TPA: GTP cyclohydrolase I FolE [Candidatus Methylomirabilis sp.]|nr:GTP cyclohydrolase I FolE [Candidatus Methylomirabilis sp.]
MPSLMLLDEIEAAPRQCTLEQAVTDILHAVGEDPGREGLLKTPERVAKSLAYLTAGSNQTVEDVLNGAIFSEDYDQMVLVKDIEFYSLCEHHMLPFCGKAHIAYLPAGRVVGLSKLPRLLEVYARRLQVQERLTQQVAWAIQEALRPRGVAVLLEASHFCMMMRGVEKQNSKTVTSALLGEFRESPALRNEFLAAVRGSVGAF